MHEESRRPLRAIKGGLATAPASNPRPTRDDLDYVLNLLDEKLATAEPRAIPSLALALSSRLATLASVLAEHLGVSQDPSRPEPTRLLTPTEAAAIAGVTRRWIYDHTRGMKFRRDLSKKSIRIEEAGFRRWLEYQRP